MPTNRNERKYAIGEVADFAMDTPILTNHYGSFIRANNQWYAKEQLPDRAKSFIRTYNYNSGIRLTDLPDSAFFAFNSYQPVSVERPCTANGVTLFNLMNTTDVFGFDSSGFFRASTGISVVTATNQFGFCTIGMVSDGTGFYAYYLDGNRQFQVKSSTNGRSWAAQTLQGIPAQNSSSIGSYWNVGNQSENNTGLCAGQCCYYHGPYLAAWCGARMLLITSDTNNYVKASLSSNRLSFSDASSMILNSNSMGVTDYNTSYFYRNGNACFLGFNSAWAYTTDGGVSWSACSGISGAQNGLKFIVNKSNPARLVAISSGSSILVSINSGATWVSRTIPESIPGQTYFSAAYVGDTILLGVASNSNTVMTFYKSTDNGASWNPVILPAGIGGIFTICHDGYRWILISTSQPLLLTSNDATVFLVRSLPYKSTNPACNALAIDNQTTLVSDNYSYIIFTKDGGVTWDTFSTSSKSGSNFFLRGSLTLATVQGTQYVLGGTPYAYNLASSSGYSANIIKTDALRNRGEFFSWPSVNPSRSGTYSYVRFA